MLVRSHRGCVSKLLQVSEVVLRICVESIDQYSEDAHTRHVLKHSSTTSMTTVLASIEKHGDDAALKTVEEQTMSNRAPSPRENFAGEGP